MWVGGYVACSLSAYLPVKSCFFLCFFSSAMWYIARIYKNLSADLSRCYVDRTDGRIASYRRLTPP